MQQKLLNYLIATTTCLFVFSLSFSQTDSLVLKNKNVIVGEIKLMQKGVLTIETDYSDNDFAIEWSGVKEIFTKTNFIITLKNGDRLNGSLRSSDSGRKVTVHTIEGKDVDFTNDDIVYLKGLKSTFWSRSYAAVDLGVNFTKANNLRQFSLRSSVGYLANKWQLDAYFNALTSSQDNVEKTSRTEYGASFRYFLPKDWYVALSLDFLSNTEQALDLRATAKAGLGKFIIHTNKSQWGLIGGLSSNNETFTNGTEKRNSLEAYAGSELNLFDTGDLTLTNSVYVYPSLTESGRWRVDFSLDTKYDLPLDLYVSMGLTLNYDNRPAAVGKETDYVFVFSVGWEFNK